MKKEKAIRKKEKAIRKFSEKVEEATQLAETVLLAIRSLHNALVALRTAENGTSIRTVHAALLDYKNICYRDENEIIHWHGNNIQQADTVFTVLWLLENTFQDYLGEK